jgi:L-threonylcarbamoyladenylate synthase
MTAAGGQPLAAQLDLAVARLRAGELVAFPTETVYGLGGDARSEAAVRRIYALKGRPADHPLIVHLAPEASLEDWAASVAAPVAALARAYWPGPLTLVLPRAPGVADFVTGGQDTVGLRKPSHPLAQALLARFGGGVAGPSANRYGRISPTSAAHVHEEFGADTPLVLDGGHCTVGLESTIVGWLGEELVLLRPGQISHADLERVAGRVRPGPAAGAPRVSGSHASHYAPRTPTSLVAANFLSGRQAGAAAVLARRPAPADYAGPLWIQAPADAAGYGRALYANLRRLDGLNSLKILVEEVPSDAQWAAVRDRLSRAAEP